MINDYCESIFQTKRRPTREVWVGSVGIGGIHPVRIQSMTTTPTADVEKTVCQIMQLADCGCEIVRVTVQGKKEAFACEAIQSKLLQNGYTIPLVADIHFYPPAAIVVADFVDKVRINPGNFADKRAQFQTIEYDEHSYAKEMEKIEEVFLPLVEKCKRLKKTIRIGVNHGSLSDRIMNRYGNSTLGMVESAIEFGEICRKNDFHELVFSMKASNPIIMIEAYRLLSQRMKQLGWDYPFHLGVTEAGAGEDGRIKSALGISSLLIDGIGDTIRVSLTEDPCREIEPCRKIISFFEDRMGHGVNSFEEKKRFQPRQFSLRGKVAIRAQAHELEPSFQWTMKPDGIFTEELVSCSLQKRLMDAGIQIFDSKSWIFFQPTGSIVHETRRFIEDLKSRHVSTPVMLCASYDGSDDDVIIQSAIEMGSVLSDRLVEGICIQAKHLSMERCIQLSFDILQASSLRMTKTEYISCPGCGRTLFDIQSVSQKIREKTSHLPNVKIAIMGCIVNGLGEMADADFGFVGSQNGKIDLYVNKTCVEKGIDIADGPDKLIQLIQSQGRWVDLPKKIFKK